MRITAIIPAKGVSTRLPGKNMQAFGDSTLIGHKVAQLLTCSLIDEVVVGSDSREILAEAADHGADVRERDAYHCDESQCSANDMIRNLSAMVDCDVVVWAHCTNPLVDASMYSDAIETYLAGKWDSLCSVTRVQRHAWGVVDGEYQPVNFDPWGERHPFASELPVRLYQNGAIFIQPHAQMLANAYFYGGNPRPFEINQPYDIDIDTQQDIEIARAIYAINQRKAVTA